MAVDQRRQMAGVDESHFVRVEVDQPGPQRDKAVEQRGFLHAVVQFADGVGQVFLRQNGETSVGADLGHEQGGGNSLAGHVADHHADTVSRQAG